MEKKDSYWVDGFGMLDDWEFDHFGRQAVEGWMRLNVWMAGPKMGGVWLDLSIIGYPKLLGVDMAPDGTVEYIFE